MIRDVHNTSPCVPEATSIEERSASRVEVDGKKTRVVAPESEKRDVFRLRCRSIPYCIWV